MRSWLGTRFRLVGEEKFPRVRTTGEEIVHAAEIAMRFGIPF